MSRPKRDSLQEYHKKRKFEETPEPEGKTHLEHKKPIFVIQKHDATQLHWDFRIEIDGVLKSWAVPKGIPTSTTERHLAVETEDHPMEYATFEGVIPQGQYGAGTVQIFDHGTYDNLKKQSMKDCYKKGDITILLHGTALQGPYALIKTSFRPNSWLLIKMVEPKPQKGKA